MTTSSQTDSRLLGDVCPPWCSGSDHETYRDEKTRSADAGSWHHSPIVDTWQGQHPDGKDPIAVRLVGFRRDNPSFESDDPNDWPDEIEAEGSVHPGALCSVRLWKDDARRLGEALILAADIMDGRR